MIYHNNQVTTSWLAPGLMIAYIVFMCWTIIKRYVQTGLLCIPLINYLDLQFMFIYAMPLFFSPHYGILHQSEPHRDFTKAKHHKGADWLTITVK
jgi:hypothetical protein